MPEIASKKEMSVLFKKHEKGIFDALILKFINVGIEHNLPWLYF